MKVETSALIGEALNWAVAKCEGLTVYKDAMLGGLVKHGWWVSGMGIDPNTWHPLAMFEPSTDWAQGGPIIERETLDISYIPGVLNYTPFWSATTPRPGTHRDPWPRGDGPTPLIAAMRCYVASKLGETAEVPQELTADSQHEHEPQQIARPRG